MHVRIQTRSEVGCVHCSLSQAWIHQLHGSGGVCEHLGSSTSVRKTDTRNEKVLPFQAVNVSGLPRNNVTAIDIRSKLSVQI